MRICLSLTSVEHLLTWDRLILALELRSAIELYQSRWQKPKNDPVHRDLTKDFLSAVDWAELERFHDFLKPFYILTKTMEGNASKPGAEGGHGAVWETLKTMDYLFVKFKQAAEETQFEEPSHFKSGIDCGWAKLEDYYIKTDRTPIYRAALALHPSYGYDYFERHWKNAMDRPQWYSDMQSAVGSLFDEYVRQAEVETQAQAGLLEDEADEIEADVNDYSSFGKSSSLWVFFPIGSVPMRSMIAFFRDRDPAGRSEPEGMESTAPSTNDVDVLSSATLAVASLATPAPSLQEETPHEEVEHQYLWRCFPDYVWSQRVRDTPSWVWGFGYDVEDSSGSRRWVCRRCIQNKNPKPRSFAEKGIQNANAHLFEGHGIRAPPDKTKSAAEKKAEKLKAKDQRSIAEVMKLDTRLPREQDIANSLAKGFDRKHFQRLLLEWIIEENHAFSVCEQGRLRQIFEYLNPLVKITDANITRTTIRRKVLSAYEMHKDKVIAALKQSCGLIHVSFDGWKSGNRHSLYGIACFFRDENSQPRKLALGVPELRTRHFGHNIAAEILDVLDAYGIQDKIGYFTLDNAESNDQAMEVIGGELGFVGSTRRGRCFGHTLNLSAKALLFGHNVEAFEERLSGEAALSEAEHTLWRRKGPVGKLHNLVVDVRRSDQLIYLLRSIQRSEFDLSSDPRIRARQPVDLIIDNDTRWLSQLYMIRRAIILRPFIEQLVLKHRQQWEQDNRSKRTGNLRKSAREPRICLEENQLTVNDWAVLEHLAKLLGFYEDAVKTLEGDGQQRKRKGGWVGSYGNVWEVIQGFEFLLEVLEDYKQLASEIPDAEHFRININLGWEKLNKYYSRLDETPIYYTALALHPAFRWGYFENEWKDNTKWVMKAKQMVREVWESDYRHLQVVRSPVDDEPVAKRQRKYYNPFQAYCERTRPVLGYGLVKEEATLSDDINEDINELELWQSSWEDGDNDVRDPISYWHERKPPHRSLSATEAVRWMLAGR
ncbi:putative AC transposase [Fusarium oxysporum f. sp. raphani]|uniref:Putative AC transposase n=1 Tax=Fusarium oxysporum f. sp. raphani TaxID=96318 RepID=A0A8J5UNQ0_FUSOX|nr:putative AC transposase [Fusarium oxysporum f. sp. raphani]